MALVLYNEIEYAQAAVKETKGRKIGGNKIKVCIVTLTKAKGCVWHILLIPDKSTEYDLPQKPKPKSVHILRRVSNVGCQ